MITIEAPLPHPHLCFPAVVVTMPDGTQIAVAPQNPAPGTPDDTAVPGAGPHVPTTVGAQTVTGQDVGATPRASLLPGHPGPGGHL